MADVRREVAEALVLDSGQMEDEDREFWLAASPAELADALAGIIAESLEAARHATGGQRSLFLEAVWEADQLLRRLEPLLPPRPGQLELELDWARRPKRR